MNFQRRMAQAVSHEDAVIEQLRQRGWLAERFGQGQLPGHVREQLRDIDTDVRWMPDIIAMKSYPVGPQLRFIDAKAGDKWRTTGNHDIEIRALESAEAFYVYAKWPVYFVFSDMSIAAPEEIREFGRPGPFYGNGSGTPYLIFTKHVCRPMDSAFGPVGAMAEIGGA